MRHLLWTVVGGVVASLASPMDAADGVVRVFVLAGQSNMVGQAPNELCDHQAQAPETRDLFAHLRKDGAWIVRDDVWIKFRDQKGRLTIGFGGKKRTGPELEFGFRVGDHLQEPVVLIKTAWGGKSLARDFRPPSAGLPADDVLAAELEQRRQLIQDRNAKQGKNDPLPTLDDLKGEYGAFYREMIAEVRDVMAHLDREFPELAGKRPELAGFVWFQGWNDQYGGQDSYGVNLRHLLRDVRRDLDAPDLPVVVAAMGQNGSKPAEGPLLTIQTAQLSLNDDPEFCRNARAFRTDVLVDTAAEALYPNWSKDLDAWRKVGGDHGYHYLGSAIWFNRIGRAMGDAMVELLDRRKA